MTDLSGTLALTVEWLNIIVGILIFIFGIIGNCLNIYVFIKPTYRNATSILYLLAFSVASCIQLVNTLLPRILSDGFQIPLVKSSNIYCQISTAISAVSTSCAICYPCWASFDQFVSTSRNAATRRYWSSKRFVYRAIVCTMLFWFIIYLPAFVFTQALGNNCILNNRIVIYIYSYGIIPIVYSILPIIFFTYFNIGIVKNLRVAPVMIISRTNKRMSRQVQRMLVPQLSILILSGIPFAIVIVYSTATMLIAKDANRLAIENLILTITRLLFYLNYVSSFYIYILISSDFRKTIVNLFKRQNMITRQTTAVVIPKVQ